MGYFLDRKIDIVRLVSFNLANELIGMYDGTQCQDFGWLSGPAYGVMMHC